MVKRNIVMSPPGSPQAPARKKPRVPDASTKKPRAPDASTKKPRAPDASTKKPRAPEPPREHPPTAAELKAIPADAPDDGPSLESGKTAPDPDDWMITIDTTPKRLATMLRGAGRVMMRLVGDGTITPVEIFSAGYYLSLQDSAAYANDEELILSRQDQLILQAYYVLCPPDGSSPSWVIARFLTWLDNCDEAGDMALRAQYVLHAKYGFYGARHDDVAKMKLFLHRLVAPDVSPNEWPSVKEDRGFNNVITGRLLTTFADLAEFDADPEAYCEKMLNFEVDNCSMAINLLYDLDLCDETTDEYGLEAIGRGPIWLKAAATIFCGNGLVRRKVRTRPNVYQICGFQEFTPRMAAYALVIIHFCLDEIFAFEMTTPRRGLFYFVTSLFEHPDPIVAEGICTFWKDSIAEFLEPSESSGKKKRPMVPRILAFDKGLLAAKLPRAEVEDDIYADPEVEEKDVAVEEDLSDDIAVDDNVKVDDNVPSEDEITMTPLPKVDTSSATDVCPHADLSIHPPINGFHMVFYAGCMWSAIPNAVGFCLGRFDHHGDAFLLCLNGRFARRKRDKKIIPLSSVEWSPTDTVWKVPHHKGNQNVDDDTLDLCYLKSKSLKRRYDMDLLKKLNELDKEKEEALAKEKAEKAFAMEKALAKEEEKKKAALEEAKIANMTKEQKEAKKVKDVEDTLREEEWDNDIRGGKTWANLAENASSDEEVDQLAGSPVHKTDLGKAIWEAEKLKKLQKPQLPISPPPSSQPKLFNLLPASPLPLLPVAKPAPKPAPKPAVVKPTPQKRSDKGKKALSQKSVNQTPRVPRTPKILPPPLPSTSHMVTRRTSHLQDLN